MSDNFTDSPFECGDRAALVSYLYDECEPDERAAIETHLSTCLSCAEEIAGLGATRRMLPAWTPPEAALGFQMTSADAPAQVLRPVRWWQSPLPAWAQAAAAAVIFAAGLAAGRWPDTGGPAAPGGGDRGAVAVRSAPSIAAPAQVASGSGREPAGPSASRAEVTRLETELRAQIARLEEAQQALGRGLTRASSPGAGDLAAGDQIVTFERVQALVQESERRQRGELLWGMEQVLSDVDLQRRRLDAVQTTVEGLGKDTWSNRQSVSALANVFSTQGGFRPVSGR